MTLVRKIYIVFISSLILNLVWENLHSLLYANYMGGKISEMILLRASIWDAIIITGISIPFLYVSFFKNREWLFIAIGITIAIAIEKYALLTGRWEYNSYMPIIPIVLTGLTPTIQLGILGYISFQIQKDF